MSWELRNLSINQASVNPVTDSTLLYKNIKKFNILLYMRPLSVSQTRCAVDGKEIVRNSTVLLIIVLTYTKYDSGDNSDENDL